MHRAINVALDLVPVGELKQNLSGVLKRLTKTRRPIVITRNGKATAVVMTPSDYEAITYRERLLASIQEGMDDADAGRLRDSDEVFDELLAKLRR